ncbi:UNVERIFIED_CONTAM: hypothetical protein GTU68_060408 [Idotea baltica]|nr:hypothetical protein [Idotea baltica]
MKIHDWPTKERPRERLLKEGSSSLSDAELLAICLRTGVAGVNAVDLARKLLIDFGGLKSILHADLLQFTAHSGLGPVKYVQLQAIREIAKRCLAEQLTEGSVLETPDVVQKYLRSLLGEELQEIFGCLLLNAKHRVLGFEYLFYGSIDQAKIYPRQVVKTALSFNAAALILVHNHPSGEVTPSHTDVAITQQLVSLLAVIDVKVLDHIIVGRGASFSMVEQGVL